MTNIAWNFVVISKYCLAYFNLYINYSFALFGLAQHLPSCFYSYMLARTYE